MSTPPATLAHQMPVGAQVLPEQNATQFRVWALPHASVSVVFEDGRKPAPLQREEGGYFSALVQNVPAGTRYKYQLGTDPQNAFPDPIARYQPEGPHHFSEVIDPGAFRWTDQNWAGIQLFGQVLYELHLGT